MGPSCIGPARVNSRTSAALPCKGGAAKKALLWSKCVCLCVCTTVTLLLVQVRRTSDTSSWPKLFFSLSLSFYLLFSRARLRYC